MSLIDKLKEINVIEEFKIMLRELTMDEEIIELMKQANSLSTEYRRISLLEPGDDSNELRASQNDAHFHRLLADAAEEVGLEKLAEYHRLYVKVWEHYAAGIKNPVVEPFRRLPNK